MSTRTQDANRRRPAKRVRANGEPAGASHAKRQGARVEEMQRRRLLLAVAEIVGEEGLQEVSVASVCGRAGVSRRTFYEIFEDREASMLAAFEDALERLGSIVIPVYRGAGCWTDRVRNALTVLLEQLDNEPCVARMCIVETLRGGPELLERRARVLSVLAAGIDEGREGAKLEGEPPPLTAQGVVGGALSVIHARLREAPKDPLVGLISPLTAMIVHPYRGPVAADEELTRPETARPVVMAGVAKDPFKDLPIRVTYRTARVLAVAAEAPGASNRRIADLSGISDVGQMSRLLRRLKDAGLIENRGEGQPKGEANAWMLTRRGEAIHLALGLR